MLMTQSAVPALVQGQTSNSYPRKRPQAQDVNSFHTADPAHPALGQSNVGDSHGANPQSYASQLAMNGIVTSAPPGAMYVRALYDYEADDRTSLSFHEGDIIQVITQLESGWWDGVINGVRGWFPSNYCQIIAGSEETPDPAQDGGRGERIEVEAGEQDMFDDNPDDEEEDDEDDDSEPDGPNGLPLGGTNATDSIDSADRNRADFWIPQATPDGRLFYYNMMTGERSMELPLESPVSTNETGPRDRMNVNMPERTRPPPEMMARGGLTRDEDDEESEVNSASEREGESLMLASRGLPVRC